MPWSCNPWCQWFVVVWFPSTFIISFNIPIPIPIPIPLLRDHHASSFVSRAKESLYFIIHCAQPVSHSSHFVARSLCFIIREQSRRIIILHYSWSKGRRDGRRKQGSSRKGLVHWVKRSLFMFICNEFGHNGCNATSVHASCFSHCWFHSDKHWKGQEWIASRASSNELPSLRIMCSWKPILRAPAAGSSVEPSFSSLSHSFQVNR